ncbi:RICIN domain-containing protein [Actinoplanes sp. DH11]|uniref:RICIN domain-containing protein n=1 Tax=Actinoplanes sp. DH11 TaxID=2857011 RepID=UPI001E303719|nr:RICIN domain-containing protein [Actinoplanes sp. DH11]
MLLIGVGLAALLALIGYTVVRPALRPAVSTSLPDQGLPVVTGPAPSASVSGSAVPGTAQPGAGEGPAGTERDGGSGPDGDNPAKSAPSGQASAVPASPTGTATPGAPAGTTTTAPATAPATRTATVAPAPPDALVPPSPLVAPEGALISGNGLCLDLQGGDAEDGGEVHVDDCNGTSPQRWQLNADRTLEVLDMCAYLVGDGGVELTRCDTRTTAQWALNERGQLLNQANGRCLTDPFFGGRPGKQVIVASCVGSNNQRWAFN